MKPKQISPAFIRYLKPRLQPFKRPLFWGSFTILSLLGVIIYQYGRYSNWLETNLDKTKVSNNFLENNSLTQIDTSQFSAEDLAIGADIDNIDLLLTKVNQNQNFSFNSLSNISTQNNQEKTLNKLRAKEQGQSIQSSLIDNYDSSFPNQLIGKKSLNHFSYKASKENSTLLSPLNYDINSQTPSSNLTANSVGQLYLLNKHKKNNSNELIVAHNNSIHSINLFNNIKDQPNSKVIIVYPTEDLLANSTIKSQSSMNQSSIKGLNHQIQSADNLNFELPTNNNFNSNNYSVAKPNELRIQKKDLTQYQKQPLNFYQINLINYQLQPQTSK